MTEDSKRRVTCRIDGKLSGLHSIPFDQRRIFRVTDRLRKVNEESYGPKMIGIGPNHHYKYYPNTSTIRAMEEHKLRYLQNLLVRKGETSLETYVGAMQNLEKDTRNCYAQPTDDLDLDEFVEMMLLDGCFIVEFLSNDGNDPFLTGPIRFGIKCDLLLFENQLPLFVLVRILEMTGTSSSPADIINLSRPLLSTLGCDMARASWESSESPGAIPVGGFDHLLELVHHCWCFPFAKKELSKSPGHRDRLYNDNYFMKCSVKVEVASRFKCLLGQSCNCCVPCANAHGDDESSKRKFIKSTSELQEAGIKFKKFSRTTLFDIKFRKGRMEIPPLRVQDDTESIFRNLVAYEQHCRGVDRKYFTDYLILMDCLVNSSKDVEILRHQGIILNALGEDEVVSKMINKLCLEVCESEKFSILGLVR